MKLNVKVVKRDGTIEDFDIKTIKIAIQHVANSTLQFTDKDWDQLKPLLQNAFEKFSGQDIIHISEIDDLVMETLIYSNFKEIAVEYIKKRKTKIYTEVEKNDLGLSQVGLELLKDRYLERDEDNKIVESPKEMMNRIATAVASAEDATEKKLKYKDEFFKILCNLEFLPNSPCLISAGSKRKGVWIACFAFDIPDDLMGMYDTYKLIANTSKLGGGAGFSIAGVREKNALISTTRGKSSGPVTLVLPVIDATTIGIKQGSFRRGAIMAIIDSSHPDIEEFIDAKSDPNVLTNMNMSILIYSDFINAVKKNGNIKLISPATKKVIKEISANYILSKIATAMWETGEPGLLFYERINKDNPTPHLGDLHLVNPCAESTLLNMEACVLGSINLVRHLKSDGDFDWDKFSHTIKLGIRFLDNIITKSPYPDIEIKKTVLKTRKIGLGIMGLADLLIHMNIKYSSDKAIKFVDRLMGFMRTVAEKESEKIGSEKGLYESYKSGCPKRRNAIVLTIAPSGSISLISGVSSGIEPNFAATCSRTLYTENKIINIEHSLKDHECFEIAQGIHWEQHLKMLATVQKHVDNAVSKTINLPEETSIEDIKKLILMGHDMGVKGLTIFRKNCKRKPLIKCDGDTCAL